MIPYDVYAPNTAGSFHNRTGLAGQLKKTLQNWNTSNRTSENLVCILQKLHHNARETTMKGSVHSLLSRRFLDSCDSFNHVDWRRTGKPAQTAAAVGQRLSVKGIPAAAVCTNGDYGWSIIPTYLNQSKPGFLMTRHPDFPPSSQPKIHPTQKRPALTLI